MATGSQMEKLMPIRITDPHTFLRNLVCKKGKSELDGIYLPHVSVVAEVSEDYGYHTESFDPDREVESIFRRDSNSWNELLVGARRYDAELAHSIAFTYGGEKHFLIFVTEGTEISLSVSIPALQLEDFVKMVTFYQALVKEVAHFVGKSGTQIRFVIGSALLPWQSLVDSGDVTEVDVGF